jgi:hypothetical protein
MKTYGESGYTYSKTLNIFEGISHLEQATLYMINADVHKNLQCSDTGCCLMLKI